MAEIKINITRRYYKPIKLLVEAENAEDAFMKVNNDEAVKAQVEALINATDYVLDVETIEESGS
jgi:hypothetical protein